MSSNLKASTGSLKWPWVFIADKDKDPNTASKDGFHKSLATQSTIQIQVAKILGV